MKLYEISREYRETLNNLMDLDGIDKETVDNTMSSIKGSFYDKAKSVACYIENSRSDLNQLKDHKKKIDARIKSLENGAESLREYLRLNMEAAGITEIKCDLFTVKIGKASEIVEITDMDILADCYTNTKTTADKIEIKKALKEGRTVDGAKLSDGKKRLIIK